MLVDDGAPGPQESLPSSVFREYDERFFNWVHNMWIIYFIFDQHSADSNLFELFPTTRYDNFFFRMEPTSSKKNITIFFLLKQLMVFRYSVNSLIWPQRFTWQYSVKFIPCSVNGVIFCCRMGKYKCKSHGSTDVYFTRLTSLCLIRKARFWQKIFSDFNNTGKFSPFH